MRVVNKAQEFSSKVNRSLEGHKLGSACPVSLFSALFPCTMEVRRPRDSHCSQARKRPAAETGLLLARPFTGFFGHPAQRLKMLPLWLAAEETQNPILLQGGAEPCVGDGLCVCPKVAYCVVGLTSGSGECLLGCRTHTGNPAP